MLLSDASTPEAQDARHSFNHPQQLDAMARMAEEHQTYRAIDELLLVSFWTNRKWVRRAKQGRLTALVSALGRPRPARWLALMLVCDMPRCG